MQCAGLWHLALDISHYQTAPSVGREERVSTGTVAAQTVAEPGEQHVLVAVAPIQKKKSKTESIGIMRDEETVGHSTRGRSRAIT